MRFSLMIGLVLSLLGGLAVHAEGMPKIADVKVKRDSPDQVGIYTFLVTIRPPVMNVRSCREKLTQARSQRPKGPLSGVKQTSRGSAVRWRS